MRITSLILIAIPVLLSSCFEKDQPVPPYSGTIYTIPHDMELYESYFDLESGMVVQVNPADNWELGFECKKDGWHIIVNSGAHWFLKNSRQNEIHSPIDTTNGYSWRYDEQSAFPDSTAAGDWVIPQGDGFSSKKEVYFLGKSAGTKYNLLKQLVFLSVNDSVYTFFYKDSENNASDTVTIFKSDTVNYVYYSFPEMKQVNLEPGKLIYDITFCPYYDVVTEFGVTGPYLVRGVLINQNSSSVFLDSVNTYHSIDISKIAGYNFSTQRDIIGYNWKEVNIDLSSGRAKYLIKDNYTYIIFTAEKKYFKLHFLTYENGGLSGVPQFEYEQLE